MLFLIYSIHEVKGFALNTNEEKKMNAFYKNLNEGGEGFDPTVDSYEAFEARQDKREIGVRNPIDYTLNGKTYIGGVPTMVQGQLVVEYPGQIYIGVNNKPDLKKMVEEYFAVRVDVEPALKTNPSVNPYEFFN